MRATCPTHGYGGANATLTIKTTGGTFHVCQGCADAFAAAKGIGPVRIGPLASENPRQRCQCEHEDHFAESLETKQRHDAATVPGFDPPGNPQSSGENAQQTRRGCAGIWYRIDKSNGAIQVSSGVNVLRAARGYFDRPNEVIAALRFQTPHAIYSDGSQLTDEEAARIG